MTRLLFVISALALCSASIVAQTPKTFEVVSIKRLDGPLRGFSRPRNVIESGTFLMPAATVLSLVEWAYEVRSDLVVDGPPWIQSDMFEVNAKVGKYASPDQMRPMVRAMLADRFGLVAQTERRVMPHFGLVPVRADRQVGPTMRRTDTCSNPETRQQIPPQPAGATQSQGCGTMASIAEGMSRSVWLPVIDTTKITGTFRYFMHYAPDESPRPIPGLGPIPSVAHPSPNTGLPTFQEALSDQLGLRMESARAPIEVVAIKAVHQPKEN